jgi:RNA polymerase sigma-70 factor (ECF subfamily)
MDQNSEAFRTEEIWEQFHEPLQWFVKRKIKNDMDVDDTVQNIFCAIHLNIQHLRAKEKMRSFIFAIAKNAVADYYRNKKKEEVLTEWMDGITEDNAEELNENHEIAECLKLMVNFLPDKYKEAILLTEFEDLTQKELAGRLGLSISGAKSRVQRARIKLKEMLIGCCQFEFDKLGNIIEYKKRCKDCQFC